MGWFIETLGAVVIIGLVAWGVFTWRKYKKDGRI